MKHPIDDVQTAARASARQLNTPHAIAASYDKKSKRVVIQFNTGLGVFFEPQMIQGLSDATDSDLKTIEISPAGLGLHFPTLDADIYLPALLEGLTGSRRWMAAHLGQKGGRSTSKVKASASRANGKRGGRPRKKPQALTA